MTSHLTSEQFAQLTPLLGSIARLIARDAIPDQTQLNTLLHGVGLEHQPDALAELTRWIAVLAPLRTNASEIERMIAVEALTLRGLPEATVLLAVSTVAGAAATTPQQTASAPPPLPIRLSVSPERLEWTNLPPDQPIAAELVVQGGPGRIVVDSDQVQVMPQQFGRETTRVQVLVKPLAGDLIFTEIQVITAGETAAVPVVASFRSGQASVQTAPPVQGKPWSEPPTLSELRAIARRSVSSPPPLPVVPTPPPASPVSPPQRTRPHWWLLLPVLLIGLGVGGFVLVRQNDGTAIPTVTSEVKIPAGPTLELVEILTGPFLMGSGDTTLHEVTLDTYGIGKTEVTNAQFRPFVEGDGYTNPAYWTDAGWQWREEEQILEPEYWDNSTWNSDTQPVVGISWFEAVAYTRWLSTQTGYDFRLPSEAEWEKAARGTDGRIWPWGNEWIAGRANSYEAGVDTTMPVSSYPDGASPYGVLDMAGNAWEWTTTQWINDYPYQVEDEWSDAYLVQDGDRVLRGGSWSNGQEHVRCAFRFNYYPHFYYSSIGVRVASHSPPPSIEE